METKLKCLVIDDEPIAIGILEDYISKVPFLELAGSYRSALKALRFVEEQPVDLIFLDIKMPDLTGIQFLRSLVEQPLVIFTTAYSEFAVESYDFQAVDYLLKPIELDRFLQAVNRALKQYLVRARPGSDRMETGEVQDYDTEALLLKSGTKYHPVRFEDILYVEGAGNYSLFFTKTKKIMVLMNLKEALQKLSAGRFCRIHKSYIVNLNQIETIGKDQIKIGTINIPIGEVYRSSLLKKLKV
jgi:DNA-binding LytR/AlgR family response regulator